MGRHFWLKLCSNGHLRFNQVVVSKNQILLEHDLLHLICELTLKQPVRLQIWPTYYTSQLNWHTGCQCQTKFMTESFIQLMCNLSYRYHIHYIRERVDTTRDLTEISKLKPFHEVYRNRRTNQLKKQNKTKLQVNKSLNSSTLL